MDDQGKRAANMNFFSFFTNPALLAGTIAGAIPIIIHLLNRQRFRRVWWAAMHWLWAAMRKAQRRLQIEQLILLLIRVLVLVLLALALARPALQAGMGLLEGRPSIYRIIVLDNSYSMGRQAGGRSLFDKGRDLAIQLVDRLTDSDDVDVILVNSSAEEMPHAEGYRRAEVIRDLRAATLSDGTTHLPRGIAAACKLIAEGRSKNVRREIVLLTDGTRAAWLAGDQPRKLEADEEKAVQDAFQDPRTKPAIYVVRLGTDASRENLALVSLEVDEKVVTADVETQLVATAHNFGTVPARGLPAALWVDGEQTAREELGLLEPGKSANISFRHTFREAGSHAIYVALETDAMPVDNTAFLALDVEKEVKVLCVDGQQRIGANASELDFFRQALSPTKSAEVNVGKMPLVPEVISDGAFPTANLDEFRLVVLANVALIPREKLAGLEQYVRRGGALWIWLGDRIDASVYNQDLGPLLPAAIGEGVGRGDPDGPFEALSEKEVTHPALERLKNIKSLPLGQLHVYRRFKLTPRPHDGTQAGLGPPRTLLACENGEPLAVEFRLGEGRVLLLATTSDKAWCNWPTKNHYMPLVNFIALDLIRPAYTLRNRQVGDRFVYQLGREELGPARVEGLRLRDPAGEGLQMDISAETFSATSPPARRAGLYVLEVPGEQRHAVHFAANRNPEESDLDPIEADQIRARFPETAEAQTEQSLFFPKAPVLKRDVLILEDDPDRLEAALKGRTSGREIWRGLVIAVLALLALESLLAMRFGNYNR